MGGFLLRRLVNYLILVLLAACVGYFLAASSLNPRARFAERNPAPPPAVVDQALYELNLNDKTPVVARFTTWAGGVVHGDLGRTVDGDPVVAELGRRMGVSMRLLLLGSVLGGVLGVLAGVVCAVRQHKLTDHSITLISFLLLSTPVFLLAVLLKLGGLSVNQAAGTTILYYTGEYTPGLSGPWWWLAANRVQHLVLPTLAVAAPSAAFYSRYQRSAMLDVLGSDFLRTALAKGLRRRRALLRHGLRTALVPMVTFFAYQFSLLLVSDTFVEKIFAWHGMGEWFIDSVATSDVNVVAAITLFAAVLVLMAGLLAELAYAVLDPRVRVR
ncbi:MAG: ABC transporter permease [Pseudonocardiales bacterium]|nr:ABC transporter permease [Pseudonocardiales bacterium]MBV9032274.1 ABC transporter permease [Pseudonocardiales bacterium]MBW0008803.1 ABC transporter permease [Pseudonocardiales bacterium]